MSTPFTFILRTQTHRDNERYSASVHWCSVQRAVSNPKILQWTAFTLLQSEIAETPTTKQ